MWIHWIVVCRTIMLYEELCVPSLSDEQFEQIAENVYTNVSDSNDYKYFPYEPKSKLKK